MKNVEIEKKFLINLRQLPNLVTHECEFIQQGYLFDENGIVLRVRTSQSNFGPGNGFITVKGPHINRLSVPEFEMEIPYSYAEEMLKKCETFISKKRYYYQFGEHTFELDEFITNKHCSLIGLWIAEIELSDEFETFEKPSWLGPIS